MSLVLTYSQPYLSSKGAASVQTGAKPVAIAGELLTKATAVTNALHLVGAAEAPSQTTPPVGCAWHINSVQWRAWVALYYGMYQSGHERNINPGLTLPWQVGLELTTQSGTAYQAAGATHDGIPLELLTGGSSLSGTGTTYYAVVYNDEAYEALPQPIIVPENATLAIRSALNTANIYQRAVPIAAPEQPSIIEANLETVTINYDLYRNGALVE
jgi:hypothetical protein